MTQALSYPPATPAGCPARFAVQSGTVVAQLLLCWKEMLVAVRLLCSSQERWNLVAVSRMWEEKEQLVAVRLLCSSQEERWKPRCSCCSKPGMVGRDTAAVVGRDTALCCSTPGVLEREWAGIVIGNAKLGSTPGIVREIADDCWLGKGRPVFVAA